MVVDTAINVFIPGDRHLYCRRCFGAWRCTKLHVTPIAYHEAGVLACVPCVTSMNILCETCWGKLTPQQRLPFYLDQVDQWAQPWSEREKQRALVIRAVGEGINPVPEEPPDEKSAPMSPAMASKRSLIAKIWSLVRKTI